MESLRRILWGVVGFTLFGVGAELYFLDHFEDAWQWTPVALLGLAALLLLWLALAPRATLVYAWRGLMFLCIASGFVGMYFHALARMEFKQEGNPGLKGAKLFWEAMHTQSPPALAPGVMIQIGLLGLAATIRHPALSKNSENLSKLTGENT